jgi:hypothetical protein
MWREPLKFAEVMKTDHGEGRRAAGFDNAG